MRALEGMELNRAANSLILLREKCVSEPRTATECTVTHDVNDLHVTADRGHILIVHCLISLYRTLLVSGPTL